VSFQILNKSNNILIITRRENNKEEEIEKKMSWNRPSVAGATPSARCAHTTTFCGDDHEGTGKLLILGGWNGTRMLNDLHVFYTGNCPSKKRSACC
jgi:hypothetical protein